MLAYTQSVYLTNSLAWPWQAVGSRQFTSPSHSTCSSRWVRCWHGEMEMMIPALQVCFGHCLCLSSLGPQVWHLAIVCLVPFSGCLCCCFFPQTVWKQELRVLGFFAVSTVLISYSVSEKRYKCPPPAIWFSIDSAVINIYWAPILCQAWL